jgi:uncharacterized membrane protein
MPTLRRPAPFPLLIGATVLLALPFALMAAIQGLDGLDLEQRSPTRFLHPDDPRSSLSLFVHMIAGAAITVLALIQTLPGLRARFPAIHRATGRVVVAAALVTAAGGLIYIARQGTIGGPGMSAGFALYGVLMALAAAQTFRFAQARKIDRHRRWALRLVWLAIGSWLYRVQYGLWHAATGGLGSTTEFDGPFDQAMFLGFFLPQLVLLELYLRRNPLPASNARPATAADPVEPAPPRG